MTAWSRTSRFALAFLGATTIPISAQTPTCPPRHCPTQPAATSASTEKLAVIVQYTSDPSEDEIAAVNQLGEVHHRLHSVNAIAVHVTASGYAALASRPGVAHISLDHKLHAHQQIAPIGTSPEFTSEPINAPWATTRGYNGGGIGVAVVDSGITPVDDLGARVVYSANFVPNENTTLDAYGHGTHVAGLIAGNGTDSTGANYTRTFTGIAPNANIINLRALDDSKLLDLLRILSMV